MSYTSRKFQASWSYNDAVDDHNARVGRILRKGVDWTEWIEKHKAATASVQDTSAENLLSKGAPVNKVGGRRPSVNDASVKAQTWVDAKTATALRPPRPLPKPAEVGRLAHKSRIQPGKKNSYSDLSMQLWKRINAGCMPQYSRTPTTTNQDSFRDWNDLSGAVDKYHHLKKTDFSEYNEVYARFMNQLMTNKSRENR